MSIAILEIFKAVILGIVEGVTEWLPISSTGHMLLVDQFLKLNMSDTFKEMFFIVIQLGAIMAVVILFWNKMMPFKLDSKKRIKIDRDIILIWVKVVIACVPGAVVTILFDNYVEKHLHTPLIIAATLIFYGIAFILVENWNKNRTFKIQNVKAISHGSALGIGLFQVLSIIPGTSRSGATIIGALLMGVSREAAAEFTFFLAVPVMFGLSALKIIKFGFAFSGLELLVLGVGMIVAFAVSVFVIKFLMSYIKKHDFKVFGWYRIVLGLLVVLYFLR